MTLLTLPSNNFTEVEFSLKIGTGTIEICYKCRIVLIWIEAINYLDTAELLGRVMKVRKLV